MSIKMFKLGVKTINGTDYVYAQKSVYINYQKTKTRSYSLGNVKKFIADLTSKITGGWIYTYSGEICLSKIAEKIGFSECVNKHTAKLPEESIYDLPSYLLTLVLYQILSPDSKSECRGWYQNSYIRYIVNLPDMAFHKNNIYHYMDKIYKKEQKIFRSLRDSAISAIGIRISELIFDTTSVFYRSEMRHNCLRILSSIKRHLRMRSPPPFTLMAPRLIGSIFFLKMSGIKQYDFGYLSSCSGTVYLTPKAITHQFG